MWKAKEKKNEHRSEGKNKKAKKKVCESKMEMEERVT